jgi:hypothetical protein
MEKIIQFNNKLLTFNNSYIRTEIVATPPPAPATWPTDGLVARWTFDDTLQSDTTISDYTWTPYTAGRTFYTTDAMNGKALDTSSALYISDAALESLWDGNTTYSVAFWMAKKAGFITFGRNNATEWDSNSFQIMTGTANSIEVARATNGLVWGVPAWPTDAYHHLVVTYDGTNSELYWDASSLSAKSHTDSMGTGGSAIFINGRGNSSYTSHNTYMDFMYIYNKALSASEVTQLYNNGAGV